MILCISHNLWGLGDSHKFISLRDLFSSICPYIILLQEKMMIAYWVLDYFWKMLPEWHMVAVKSMGLFGGFAASWDQYWTSFRAHKCFPRVFLSGRLWGLVGRLHLLNLYSHYRDRTSFWDRLDASNLLKIGSLIVVKISMPQYPWKNVGAHTAEGCPWG